MPGRSARPRVAWLIIVSSLSRSCRWARSGPVPGRWRPSNLSAGRRPHCEARSQMHVSNPPVGPCRGTWRPDAERGAAPLRGFPVRSPTALSNVTVVPRSLRGKLKRRLGEPADLGAMQLRAAGEYTRAGCQHAAKPFVSIATVCWQWLTGQAIFR